MTQRESLLHRSDRAKYEPRLDPVEVELLVSVHRAVADAVEQRRRVVGTLRASGVTLREIAETLEVGHMTVWRWTQP